MMDKYMDYLRMVGFDSKPILKKIIPLYRACFKFCTEEIEDIFVSEYLNADQTNVFESLFLFSSSYIFEIKQPLQTDIHWETASIACNILGVDVQATSYDFEDANKKSRLIIEIFFDGDDWRNEFKATGDNCDVLWAIANKYIKPNIARR
jgi:hypothetical protein